MKYQLIGRKSVLTKSSRKKIQEDSSFLRLPQEILLEIFECLRDDPKTLLSLSKVCSRIHVIINKNFIYKRIEITDLQHFLKFRNAHLPHDSKSIARRFARIEPGSNINYIESVKFVNPPIMNDSNLKMSIAGSYDVSDIKMTDNKNQYDEYVDAFTTLMREAYGIKRIEIYEISHLFAFPSDYSEHSGFFSSKRPKPQRRLGTLILNAQSGWTIPFKYTHVSTVISIFQTIDEVRLHKFTVDLKLCSSSLSQAIRIRRLVLDSCMYNNSAKCKQSNKKKNSLFESVSELVLLNVQSSGDLSVIDYIKSNNLLKKLSIDINSKVFYKGGVENSKVFNFGRFNLFFKLLCSGQNAYGNLTELELINFDLYKYHNHQSTDRNEDPWVQGSDDNLETFLRYIAPIRKLTLTLRDDPVIVHTCMKCGFKKSERASKSIYLLDEDEWMAFLKPLIQENNSCLVRILDLKKRTLYSYSREN